MYKVTKVSVKKCHGKAFKYSPYLPTARRVGQEVTAHLIIHNKRCSTIKTRRRKILCKSQSHVICTFLSSSRLLFSALRCLFSVSRSATLYCTRVSSSSASSSCFSSRATSSAFSLTADRSEPSRRQHKHGGECKQTQRLVWTDYIIIIVTNVNKLQTIVIS